MRGRRPRPSPRLAALGLALLLGLSASARADEPVADIRAIDGWIEILSNPQSEAAKVQLAIDKLRPARADWVKARLRNLIENNSYPGTPRLYDITEVYLQNFVMDEGDVRLVLKAHRRLHPEVSNIRELMFQLGEARFKPTSAQLLIDDLLADPKFTPKHLFGLAVAQQENAEFAVLSSKILERIQNTSSTLTDRDKFYLAKIALERGRGSDRPVVDALWRALISSDNEIVEAAARTASGLKTQETRFKKWFAEALGSSQVSSRTLVTIAASWNMHDDETIQKLAVRLRNGQDDDQASSILSHLLTEQRLPPEAQTEVLRFLDNYPRSSQALSVLIHHHPAESSTLEYAAKALATPLLGAQNVAISALEKATPLDAHIQNVLAQGFLNGHKDTLIKVGVLLKTQGYDGLESLLLEELRKGEKARNSELILTLIETAGPWSEEFETSLKQLSGSRKKEVARLAEHALRSTVKSLPAGPGDAEEMLLSQLTDPDSGVRRRAIQSLSNLKENEHIAHTLVGRLALEKNDSVRADIAKTLFTLEVHDVRVQIALWDLFNAEEGLAAIQAVSLLKKIRPIDPVLYPKICELLARGDVLKHLKVFQVLSAHAPLNAALQTQLFDVYFAHGEKNRELFREWFPRAGITREEIENQALRALKLPDPKIRAGASSIQFSEDAGGAEATAHSLIEEKDPSVRRALVQTLLRSEPNGFLSQQALLDIFEKGPSPAAQKAYEMLHIGGELDSSLLPRLEKAMASGNKFKEEGAAAMVALLSDLAPDDTQRLVSLLPKLSDTTRTLLADTLESLNSEFVVVDALKLLGQRDPVMRMKAAALLQGPRAAEADVQGSIFLALKKEKNIYARTSLWRAAQGQVWAEEMPEAAKYLEEALTSPLDRESRELVLNVIRGWCEESPTLLPVLARFKDKATHPDQKFAAKIHAEALKSRPDFSDFAEPAPERCVPGGLARIWPFGKKTKH